MHLKQSNGMNWKPPNETGQHASYLHPTWSRIRFPQWKALLHGRAHGGSNADGLQGRETAGGDCRASRMSTVRRKGKPYNPTSPVHDRRSSDLLRNAQVGIIEIDDPYEHGGKLLALRSTRNDPLARLHDRRQI